MLNQCNFIGRVGRDPESRYTADGQAVCNFSVACGEKYKDKAGNMQEKTEWVSVVVWGRLAEICQEYLAKGSLCYISGKMQTRKWQDKDGNDKYTTEIVAREMKMLSGKGDGQRDSGGFPAPPSTGEMPDDSNVPF